MPRALLSRRAAIASTVLAVAGRKAAAAARVRVGSKPDTEGSLLGNLILATLAARGVATQDRIGIGPTRIVRSALLTGEIDIYPEYTGNGAFFFQRESDPAWRDDTAGFAMVRSLDRAANDLVWLRAAPANNAWAIAVRGDVAANAKLETMVDFARHVRSGAAVKIAASAEFVESTAALPAFEAAYDFSLRRGQVLMLVGGNTAVTEKAAADGTNGVNAAMAYGTDGALAALGLVVMADTRAAQLLFEPAPVVRAATLAMEPRIAEWLDPVFASLDAATLRRLNGRIAVDGENPGEVARSHLHAIGQAG